MDHYVVTAVSEERNVSCNVNSSYGREYSCNISVDGNVNDYRFTVYSVTLVNDTFYKWKNHFYEMKGECRDVTS